jgi:uncharacterized membrane protein YeiH
MTAAAALLVLDLLGVFVFALSGGLVAVRKRFDLLSVLILAGAAGLGGGVLRDVLIGAVPPVGVSDWRLAAAACAAGAITFPFHPRVSRIQPAVQYLDAAGLGLFAVAGTLKALELGTPALTAVIVGTLTGVGGGVLRDVLAGDPPRLLADPTWQATPALLGAAAYAAAWTAGATGPAVAAGCVVLVAALRILSLTRGWQSPAPRATDA